jgi:hypothetical protein
MKHGLSDIRLVSTSRLCDLEDSQPRAALCFIRLLHGLEDLVRHGGAEIGSEQRGFEFFEGGAG